MKKIIFFLVIICAFLVGCSQKNQKSISLDMFVNENGNYEFVNLPFGKSVTEIEDLLNIDFEELQQEDDITRYSLHNFYEYNNDSTDVTLEFYQDSLQTVMFAIQTDDSETEQVFSELSETLIDLYGTPTDTIENEGMLPELNDSSIMTKGMRWDSSMDKSTSLQLVMMTGDKIKPTLSLGVGILK